ncbi:MAG: hypothetical protein KDD55_12515 [Bdellovibrionales bacterium]|nr:hypothetical protein [Bdellovibrionales bacterium]
MNQSFDNSRASQPNDPHQNQELPGGDLSLPERAPQSLFYEGIEVGHTVDVFRDGELIGRGEVRLVQSSWRYSESKRAGHACPLGHPPNVIVRLDGGKIISATEIEEYSLEKEA